MDVDGSMMEDRKAILGYAFMITGGTVSWSTKKQEIVSLSTTKSEYVAVTYAAKEALWLCSLIFQLFGTILPSTTLFSDNQSAIALTKEHQYHAQTMLEFQGHLVPPTHYSHIGRVSVHPSLYSAHYYLYIV